MVASNLCRAMTFQPNADDILEHNVGYAAEFPERDLQGNPIRGLAIVACMDSRLDPFEMMGLRNGDAHIIRNAGGVITDDVIRSLCLSQRYLGTREVLLVHHTDCGLQKVDEGEFRAELNDELGVKPRWSLEVFSDPYDDVRQSMQRLKMTPFIPHKDHIRGFVYNVGTGKLEELQQGDRPPDQGKH